MSTVKIYCSAIKANGGKMLDADFYFASVTITASNLDTARITALDHARTRWPQDEGYYDYAEDTHQVPDRVIDKVTT